MWNGRQIETGPVRNILGAMPRYSTENDESTSRPERREPQLASVVNFSRYPGEDLSSQIPRLVADRQLNRVNKTTLEYRAEKQSIVARLDRCDISDRRENVTKEKVTVFPARIDAITQVEITKGGKFVLVATKKNNLYIIDIRELEKTQGMAIHPRVRDEAIREYFKVIEKEENENIIQNLSSVLGPKTKRTCTPARNGINVIELSENEVQILTCGSTSNIMQVIEVDVSRARGDTREPKGTDEELEKLYGKNLDYDPLEIYSKLGAMKVTASAYTSGVITGGVWLNQDVVALTCANGHLNIYRLNDKRINATKESSPWYDRNLAFNPTLSKLVATAIGLRFPYHSLPVSGGTQFPSLTSMTNLVGITCVQHRDEVLVTGEEGEVHILKTVGSEGITTRGARREGIPREYLFFTEQRRNKVITCQGVDQQNGTAIVGSLFGISICDSRTPHLLQHIKMDIKTMRLTQRRRELDFGMPCSLAAANNVVTVGLCDGYIIHCDVRTRKWLMDGENKLCWYMGVKERFGYEHDYFPYLYPLRTLKKKDNTVAVGGGPVFGQIATDFDLNGVLSLWK